MRRVTLALGIGAAALVLVRCSAFSAGDAPVSEDAAPDSASESSIVVPPDASDAAAHCTAELTTDPKNCGRCGHDCLGGGCAAGECQPFVFAAGLTNPREIALTASGVYWEVGATAKHDVVRCARGGCGAGPDIVLGGLDDVRSLLVVDTTMLFVTQDTTSARNVIEGCDVASCANTRRTIEGPVTNVFPAFTPLRRGTGGVYWASLVTSSGEVHFLPLQAGAEPAVVASTGCSPRRVAPGSADITWTCAGSSELRRCTLPCNADGGVTLVASGAATVDHLERQAGHTLWDTDTELVIRDDATAAMRALPARGTGPLVVVGTDLVFQDGLRSEIRVCALPSCVSVVPLAKATVANNLAADETAVFWTVAGAGTVMAVAR